MLNKKKYPNFTDYRVYLDSLFHDIHRICSSAEDSSSRRYHLLYRSNTLFLYP